MSRDGTFLQWKGVVAALVEFSGSALAADTSPALESQANPTGVVACVSEIRRQLATLEGWQDFQCVAHVAVRSEQLMEFWRQRAPSLDPARREKIRRLQRDFVTLPLNPAGR